MTDFHRLSSVARSAVERVHGESVTLIPISRGTDVNAAPQLLQAASFDTVACFFENTLAENDALVRPLTGQGRMQHAAPAISASIRIDDGRSISAGFIVRRHRDGQHFQIGTFKPDGLGAVFALLNTWKVKPEEAP